MTDGLIPSTYTHFLFSKRRIPADLSVLLITTYFVLTVIANLIGLAQQKTLITCPSLLSSHRHVFISLPEDKVSSRCHLRFNSVSVLSTLDDPWIDTCLVLANIQHAAFGAAIPESFQSGFKCHGKGLGRRMASRPRMVHCLSYHDTFLSGHWTKLFLTKHRMKLSPSLASVNKGSTPASKGFERTLGPNYRSRVLILRNFITLILVALFVSTLDALYSTFRSSLPYDMILMPLPADRAAGDDNKSTYGTMPYLSSRPSCRSSAAPRFPLCKIGPNGPILGRTRDARPLRTSAEPPYSFGDTAKLTETCPRWNLALDGPEDIMPNVAHTNYHRHLTYFVNVILAGELGWSLLRGGQWEIWGGTNEAQSPRGLDLGQFWGFWNLHSSIYHHSPLRINTIASMMQEKGTRTRYIPLKQLSSHPDTIILATESVDKARTAIITSLPVDDPSAEATVLCKDEVHKDEVHHAIVSLGVDMMYRIYRVRSLLSTSYNYLLSQAVINRTEL
ncbi:hypothetical protein ACRALDRAFT_209466 [Sodiomyces alcalophilus JCM 7366]|uniref:uncharacterized protein n=1 Tax=Sodiomyces alcalophilus JCM 7366 TaxID=591952 RepID=UPI0039B4BEDF